MKSSDPKIDPSLRAFTKRWMKSLNRPRASTTLGYFFVGLFILFWSSSITSLTGFYLQKVWGTLVFLGIALILSLTTLLIVRLMALLGLDRSIRSALLFSAVIGPYVNMLAQQNWKISVVSHVLGFIAAIAAFLCSLLLDRLLATPVRKQDEE